MEPASGSAVLAGVAPVTTACAVPRATDVAASDQQLCTLSKTPPAATTTAQRRLRKEHLWKRVQRKSRRVAGLEYVNTKGEVVQGKQMGPPCTCRNNCYTRVDESTRATIFAGFYALRSYDEQNAYLFGLIRRRELARAGAAGSERRTCNYQYFVRSKGREIQLCKLAFANIHAISFKKIRMLSQKLDQNVMFPRDQRGKHMNRPTKIADHLKDQVRRHIGGLLASPQLRSYLKEERPPAPAELNLARMHADYLRRHEPDAFRPGADGAADPSCAERPRSDYKPQVKIWFYSRIYHSEFSQQAALALRGPAQRGAAGPPPPTQRATPARSSGAAERRAQSRQKARERLAAPRPPAAESGPADHSAAAAARAGTLQQQQQQPPAAGTVPAAAAGQQQPLVVQHVQLPTHQVDGAAAAAAASSQGDLLSLSVEQVDGLQQLVLQPAARAAVGSEPLQLCLPITCLPQPLNLHAQPLNLHTHSVFSVQPAAPSVGTQTQPQCAAPVSDASTGALPPPPPPPQTEYGGELQLVTAAAGAVYDWQPLASQ